MYFGFLVKIPDVKGKIYEKTIKGVTYITQTSHPKSGHKACINAGWDTNQLIS